MRIAAGSHPVALTTRMVRSAGGAPAARTSASAASGSRRSVATPMSARPRPTTRCDGGLVDVDDRKRRSRRGVPGRGKRELAGVASAEHADAPPGRQKVARLRCGGANVKRLERVRKWQVARQLGPGSTRADVGSAANSDLRRARNDRCHLVEAKRRKRHRRKRDDGRSRRRRVRKRLAGSSGLAGEDAAGIRDGVVHLPARRDDLEDALRHRVGVAVAALGDLAVGRRVETEALDLDLELMPSHRPGGIELLGGLREEAGRVDDAVGADLGCDLPSPWQSSS